MNETTTPDGAGQAAPDSTPVPQPTPEAPPQYVPAAAAPSSGYNDSGWSWGGFAFNWVFAIALRKYVYLFGLVLLFIPLVNFVAMLGFAIYFGMKGRELAASSTTFSSDEQRLGFMKGIDHAGKVVVLFYVILAVIGIAAAILLASLGGARDRAIDAQFEMQQRALEAQLEIERDKMMNDFNY